MKQATNERETLGIIQGCIIFFESEDSYPVVQNHHHLNKVAYELHVLVSDTNSKCWRNSEKRNLCKFKWPASTNTLTMKSKEEKRGHRLGGIWWVTYSKGSWEIDWSEIHGEN